MHADAKVRKLRSNAEARAKGMAETYGCKVVMVMVVQNLCCCLSSFPVDSVIRIAAVLLFPLQIAANEGSHSTR